MPASAHSSGLMNSADTARLLAEAGTISGEAAAATDMVWPPSGKQGAKAGCKAGKIAFAGYNWVCKDSGGGRVGPGNNVRGGTGILRCEA